MFEREAKTYIIKSVGKDFDWKDIEKAPIDIFCWRYDYKPTCFGQLVFVDENELRVRLTCYEENPETTCTKFGEDVYKDSCLEFFAAFNQKKPEIYVNCEVNSAGAALMSIGNNDGETRVPAPDILGHIPFFKGEVFSDHWCAEIHLTNDEISALFDGVKLKKGFKFTGNMFKCGDETRYEHYGMWCRSIAVIPQFHRPEYFGDFIIE